MGGLGECECETAQGEVGTHLCDALLQLGVVVWRVWWGDDADEDGAVRIDALLLGVVVLCRHLR